MYQVPGLGSRGYGKGWKIGDKGKVAENVEHVYERMVWL